jgi:hypothetical protein
MRICRAALFLLLIGCSPAELDILSHPLASGGTVADRKGEADRAVALLIRPSDVFTCGNHISRWLDWGREHPGRFLLVFSREPTEAERKQLRLFRIRPDATLVPSRAASRQAVPREYLISEGRVVRTGQVEPGVPESPLLIAMEREDRRAALQDY